uniref:Uncharacterized protein n=1 Tax=Siphoviridae sp. ctnmH5 TaxID=2825665 RepID=A0A8S5TWB6_9CAUD|nr:MAG TPA: hypothetical protein [Siphoviridae sp. ctnmH5]DAZ10542.1 MAG TPA: hypothetical protein [Caudoviricetes sp.]
MPPFYKKTWQHELPSGMKKTKTLNVKVHL